MAARMSTQEVAEYIGVASETLRSWRLSGRTGPAYFKLGSKIYYLRDDVDSWLAAQRHESAESVTA